MEKVSEFMSSFVSSLGEQNIDTLYGKVPQGKMLRARLILEIAKSSKQNARKLAAIVEMIHAASLLHDDVIDDANTRRGAKSFNTEFGDKSAIMMGDILDSRSFAKLAEFQSEIAVCISNAVSFLSIGELLDVELSKSFNTDREKYFKMIYCKTASLIEASAKSAALLEGLDADDFALYGKNLGLAFQIIDDVLDITSTSSMLGKPVMNDFKEGKVTLPYLYMLDKCSEKEKKHFKSMHKKSLNSYEIGWIKDKMEEAKAIKRSIDEAKRFGNEALEVIKKHNNKNLENIITQMIERDF
jgi:octaprenyl-diphosphate synthase